MIYKKVDLWENCPSDFKSDAAFYVYCPDNSPEIEADRKRKTVLVLPGGGYCMTSDREAEPMALAFVGEGFNAFVLRYSHAPDAKYPTQILEVSRALWLIREHADEWHVDVDNIAVCGFSAGGHLTASIGNLWNREFIADMLKMPEGMNKPNKLILCYPVITSDPVKGHIDSFYNLLGGKGKPQELYDSMSMEKLVGEQTPPSFIWHTFTDSGVPVYNSLLFATALKDNNIPFELHIYPDGEHGLSLCDERTAGPEATVMMHSYNKRWFEECIRWLNR